MTNEQIYDSLIYELTFDNGIKLTGSLDKLSNHLAYHAMNDVSPIKFEDFLAQR